MMRNVHQSGVTPLQELNLPRLRNRSYREQVGEGVASRASLMAEAHQLIIALTGF
jgi:hypothetical protein